VILSAAPEDRGSFFMFARKTRRRFSCARRKRQGSRVFVVDVGEVSPAVWPLLISRPDPDRAVAKAVAIDAAPATVLILRDATLTPFPLEIGKVDWNDPAIKGLSPPRPQLTLGAHHD
jgi:hypothetical protein